MKYIIKIWNNYVYTHCKLFITAFLHIQKIDTIKSMPNESDHAGSGKLEENAKSLQSKLTNLEEQNRDSQEKLENVQ